MAGENRESTPLTFPTSDGEESQDNPASDDRDSVDLDSDDEITVTANSGE
jgi:hypothetical protein